MNDQTAARDGDRPDTDALMATVGQQIRVMRKNAKLTMEELSARSGVSTGLISLVERGKGNPSFSTLVQLSHGLGVPIGRLFHIGGMTSPVVRKNNRKPLDPHGLSDDATYELLTPSLDGALEVTWVETPPGHDTSATPFKHNGEEFGLVLSGSKIVYLDGVPHELGPGDSITYQSSIPHWYVNPGDETCTAVWVITPPTW